MHTIYYLFIYVYLCTCMYNTNCRTPKTTPIIENSALIMCEVLSHVLLKVAWKMIISKRNLLFKESNFSLHVSFGGCPYSILNLGRDQVDYKQKAANNDQKPHFGGSFEGDCGLSDGKVNWKWRFPIGISSSSGSIFRFHASFLGCMASYQKLQVQIMARWEDLSFLHQFFRFNALTLTQHHLWGPMFCVKSHEPHTPTAETGCPWR